MNCPECGKGTEVLDSRVTALSVRRRRRCLNEHRFTTYESLERSPGHHEREKELLKSAQKYLAWVASTLADPELIPATSFIVPEDPATHYTQKREQMTRAEIVAWMQQHPGARIAEIADHFGLRDNTIRRHLKIIRAAWKQANAR